MNEYKYGRVIEVFADEEKDYRIALDFQSEGRFASAIGKYDEIIGKNPSSYYAYWGRFSSVIQARNDSEIAGALKNATPVIYRDFETALSISADPEFSKYIVARLIEGISSPMKFEALKYLFDMLSKYTDDDNMELLFESVFAQCDRLIEKGKITDCREWLEFISKSFDLSADDRYYMTLLRCKLRCYDIENRAFIVKRLPENEEPGEDVTKYTVSELVDKIVVLACRNSSSKSLELLLSNVIHRINNSIVSAASLIGIIVKGFDKAGEKRAASTFIMTVADAYTARGSFRNAERYYLMSLAFNSKNSMAHFGLLKAKLHAKNDYELIKKRKKLDTHPEFSDAVDCASESEYGYYMGLLSAQSLKSSRGDYRQKAVVSNRLVSYVSTKTCLERILFASLRTVWYFLFVLSLETASVFLIENFLPDNLLVKIISFLPPLLIGAGFTLSVIKNWAPIFILVKKIVANAGYDTGYEYKDLFAERCDYMKWYIEENRDFGEMLEKVKTTPYKKVKGFIRKLTAKVRARAIKRYVIPYGILTALPTAAIFTALVIVSASLGFYKIPLIIAAALTVLAYVLYNALFFGNLISIKRVWKKRYSSTIIFNIKDYIYSRFEEKVGRRKWAGCKRCGCIASTTSSLEYRGYQSKTRTLTCINCGNIIEKYE